MAIPIEPSSAAFLCIDIQESAPPSPLKEADLPVEWREMGFTAADVNGANTHAWEVALPNAVQVAAACRRAGLPMIFVHWGYLFEDGMDLDPDIYQAMGKNHGADAAKWHGHIRQPHSQPAQALNIQPGEYVLPKAGQDAFRSSNLDFLLTNLAVKTLIMVGGHTGACFGKTARSAIARDYAVVCIDDATTDARESTRLGHLADIGFSARMQAAEFIGRIIVPS